MSRIEPEGYDIALKTLFFAVFTHLAIHPKVAVPLYLLTAFDLWFFRNPTPLVLQDPKFIVSASSGTVKEIVQLNDDPYLKEPVTKVVVILSLLDVHINRVPIDGIVRSVDFEDGPTYPIYWDVSYKNQKNHIHIVGDNISAHVIQMAGSIARKIVCRKQVGDTVKKGEMFGLIKFGSRTDLIIPTARIKEILVQPGQRLVSGQTPIFETKTL